MKKQFLYSYKLKFNFKSVPENLKYLNNLEFTLDKNKIIKQ